MITALQQNQRQLRRNLQATAAALLPAPTGRAEPRLPLLASIGGGLAKVRGRIALHDSGS